MDSLKKEHLKFDKLYPGKGVDLHNGYRIQRAASGTSLEVLKNGKKIKIIKNANIDPDQGIWEFRLLEDKCGRKFVTYYTSSLNSWKDEFNLIAIEDPNSPCGSTGASSSVAGTSSDVPMSSGGDSYDDKLYRREEQSVAQYVLSPNSLGLGPVEQEVQLNNLYEGRGFGLGQNYKVVREGNDLVLYANNVELDRLKHNQSDKLNNFRLFKDQDGRKFAMYTRVDQANNKYENVIAPFPFLFSLVKVVPPTW